MIFSDTWHFLDHYKEFIVNGLDLASFILVTPELLRIARPALSRAVYFPAAPSLR